MKTATASILPIGYDTTTVTAGILHIGLGNFAMAHICDFTHALLGECANSNWGIIAASLRSGTMLNALRKHGNRYILVEKQGSARRFKEMAPIVDTIYAPEDPSKVIDQIANPSIKLVTMTISEKGYCLANGGLDLTNPHVVHDLSEPTEVPQTVYYYLAKGLAARAAANAGPIVIMSLDNVQSNSKQLHTALLGYLAQQNDTDLIAWVEDNCDFPVTLVDRITPEVKDEFRHETTKLLGHNPGVLIGTETFSQLVFEKTRFEMPPFEQLPGVKRVDSCADYWPRKFYMLNAVHQVLGIVGMRLGVETIHNAMDHDALAGLAKRAHEEFFVFLAGEDDELAEYSDVILARFADPSMNDSVVRVTKGTTRKVSERVLSSVEKATAAGGEMPKAAIFTAACWALNLGGCDEFAQPIGGEDVEGDRLGDIYVDFVEHLRVAVRCKKPGDRQVLGVKLVKSFLSKVGSTLGDARFGRFAANEAFVEEFARWVLAIEDQGVEAAINTLLATKAGQEAA